MAKIVKFPNIKTKNPKDFIMEAADIAEQNQAESVLIALKLKDGTVMTGYLDADYGVRMELLGHVQADIIDQMIQANYLT